MRHWQPHPRLKKAGKFILISAITYGPAGLSGWAVKSVARRPLKILLAWALEPLIRRVIKRASVRWAKP
ncbi:phage shock protein PspD [Erwinia sorbitola]|uniref:Phage shock protein PspD n=1 Tax=Erwinia sorbitola TaxID=2681984 RepID=A0A6I6ECW0_9GAMM|nr:phage shock protein PspD [Erwinia sorbitola]MTD25809.1 phage shock protein PspD [Erwinia sorbitola]QGU87637.1 phage shock protein PspD [Erwinia sorbitola]